MKGQVYPDIYNNYDDNCNPRISICYCLIKTKWKRKKNVDLSLPEIRNLDIYFHLNQSVNIKYFFLYRNKYIVFYRSDMFSSFLPRWNLKRYKGFIKTGLILLHVILLTLFHHHHHHHHFKKSTQIDWTYEYTVYNVAAKIF